MLVRIQTERSISVQRVNELAAGKAGFNVATIRQADLDGGADLLSTCADAVCLATIVNAVVAH